MVALVRPPRFTSAAVSCDFMTAQRRANDTAHAKYREAMVRLTGNSEDCAPFPVTIDRFALPFEYYSFATLHVGSGWHCRAGRYGNVRYIPPVGL